MSKVKNNSDLKVDLENIESKIKLAKENLDNNGVLFDIFWRIRSDVEYYIALLKLDFEEKIDVDKITKVVRIAKEDKEKNRLLNIIEEAIANLKNNDDYLKSLESLWKIRETITVLIRETEPKPEKMNKGN